MPVPPTTLGLSPATKLFLALVVAMRGAVSASPSSSGAHSGAAAVIITRLGRDPRASTGRVVLAAWAYCNSYQHGWRSVSAAILPLGRVGATPGGQKSRSAESLLLRPAGAPVPPEGKFLFQALSQPLTVRVSSLLDCSQGNTEGVVA
jgi:hypothetical protein